jgi:hypothetical protein
MQRLRGWRFTQRTTYHGIRCGERRHGVRARAMPGRPGVAVDGLGRLQGRGTRMSAVPRKHPACSGCVAGVSRNAQLTTAYARGSADMVADKTSIACCNSVVEQCPAMGVAWALALPYMGWDCCRAEGHACQPCQGSTPRAAAAWLAFHATHNVPRDTLGGAPTWSPRPCRASSVARGVPSGRLAQAALGAKRTRCRGCPESAVVP